MIRRDHIFFFLRRRTIQVAAALSLCLVLAIPAISLLFVVLGALPWCLLVLLYVVFGILFIGGAICTLAILSGEGAPVGIVGLIVAILSYQFLDKGGPRLQVYANDSWQTMCNSAWWLLNDLYHAEMLWLWLWAPLMGTLLVAGCALSAIGVLRAGPRLLRWFLRIRFVCEACGENANPHYRCSRCRTVLLDLNSSRYGILSAACGSCGQPIRTFDFTGRRKLDKVCAKCGADQFHPAWGRLPDFGFTLVGGQGAGKSNLMIAILRETEAWARKRGFRLDDGPDAAGHAYRDGLQHHLQGAVVSKTPTTPRPRALECSLEDSDGRGVLLRFNDAAGEDFQNSESLITHRSLQHTDVFVLTMDPAAEEAATAVARPLQFIERFQCVPTGARVSSPLAIVLTKSDKVNDSVLVSSGASRALSRIETESGAMLEGDLGVRALLLHEATSTVSQLEARFSRIAYFSCSALGRCPDPSNTRPFEPGGVEPLALWLLDAAGALPRLGLSAGQRRVLADVALRTTTPHRHRRATRAAIAASAGSLLLGLPCLIVFLSNERRQQEHLSTEAWPPSSFDSAHAAQQTTSGERRTGLVRTSQDLPPSVSAPTGQGTAAPLPSDGQAADQNPSDVGALPLSLEAPKHRFASSHDPKGVGATVSAESGAVPQAVADDSAGECPESLAEQVVDIVALRRMIEYDMEEGRTAVQARRGFDSYLRTVVDERMHYWEQAEDLDWAQGLWIRAVCYDQGLGVPADRNAALIRARRAADSGEPFAMYYVGCRYINGDGLQKDDAQAAHWFARAAGLGNLYAMNNLGLAYLDGKGVKRDERTAAQWFHKSAELGHREGMANLARLYMSGQGVPRDAVQGAKWARRAAELGDAVMMTTVGSFYLGGQGLPQNRGEANRWFRKAGELGEPYAMTFLGLMADDDAEAVKWLRKAAEAGQANAMYWLGARYANGQGVPQDQTEAAKWYRRAAELGDVEAMFMTAQRYDFGTGVTRDASLSVKWYQKAADSGHAIAMYNLGVAYAKGEGVPPNQAKAVELYRAAARAGNPRAQVALRQRGESW